MIFMLILHLKDCHLKLQKNRRIGFGRQEKSICIDSAISGKADVNERVELLYKITFKNDSQI